MFYSYINILQSFHITYPLYPFILDGTGTPNGLTKATTNENGLTKIISTAPLDATTVLSESTPTRECEEVEIPVPWGIVAGECFEGNGQSM